MKCAAVFALVALVACTSATDVKVTPVQKVIQLMQGMLEKGKKEKHDEQVQFAAYKQFCDDTTVEKQRAIKEVTARERNDPTAGLASLDFFPASFGAL